MLCHILLGGVCCAALAFANLIPTNAVTHISQSPLISNPTTVNGKLRYKANSNICETIPGVNQKSGYITVGQNMSMWFWFFESRSSPETAPLTLWLNGGPGASSMIGLFQENGPCYVNPDNETTVINKYSWNNVSNIIYIDQPIGVGFSHGTLVANSTDSAAPFLWEAFQVLFSSDEFKQFQNRELVFATESYGGRYGPAFVTYFNEQNRLIDQGRLSGIKVEFDALLINNGWFDPLIAHKSYIDFATDAPRYGPLQKPDVINAMTEAYYGLGGCSDLLQGCYALGNSSVSNGVCYAADVFCRENVEALAGEGYYEYDLRQKDTSTPCPYDFFEKYLNSVSVREAIGAEVPFVLSSDPVEAMFNATGDDARSGLEQLQNLVDSKLRTLIWAGDADINCNWLGGNATVHAMDWYGKGEFAALLPKVMMINDQAIGQVTNLDNFSWAVVYNAGHEIPAYQPIVGFEVFRQIIQMKGLHNVTGTYPAPGPGTCPDYPTYSP